MCYTDSITLQSRDFMPFSAFLNRRRLPARELLNTLMPHFRYVSILGADICCRSIRADKNTSAIRNDSDTECGFVVRMLGDTFAYEYSLDDIAGDVPALAGKILEAYQLSASLSGNTIAPSAFPDAPLKRSFARENDLADFSDETLLAFCKDQVAAVLEKSQHVLNAIVSVGTMEVSKLFLSPNRELDQHYCWVNGVLYAVYRNNDRVVQVREGSDSHLVGNVLAELPTLTDKLLHKAEKLSTAKPITPGIYDAVTDPSLTGLIAHEAFGHGVELDQFVKDRALAKEYVGKYVASPICNMRDGAASVLSAASYFFDDDGVLAGDTQIIRDGILVAGISDLSSATQLGLTPTGNGRRESTRRKAYSRMTNTFFEKGTDKLEDMIASIDHGYMLFETNNGMEDPKNWAIQCVAEYGIEIIDGKLTDNYVAPVVISGYVPDLLKSISMVSDGVKVAGSGMCGKGYKEWVRVSDGGPALKVKVKLG